MCGHDTKLGSESRKLRKPVSDERGGHDQDTRNGGAAHFGSANAKQRYDLQGFAESHVVREAGAETQPAYKVQPSDSALLIRAKRRAHPWNSLHVGRFPELLKQLRQIFPATTAVQSRPASRSSDAASSPPAVG